MVKILKKAFKKVTKPFTKVAKKIVPKEIAGIMRAAAPFLPAGYREAAYLLGTAKQTGRISPMDLALTAAPTFFTKTTTGQNLARGIGNFKLPGMEKDLRTLAIGSPREVNFTEFQGPQRIVDSIDPGITTKAGLGGQNIVTEATQGIFGRGGDYNLLKGSVLAKPDGTISPIKAGSFGVGVLSLISSAKTPQEAGENLVAQTGNSDDYERGKLLFSQLTPELFAVPERFRLPAKGGGLMRTNFAMGSDDDPKPLPEDPTKPINPFGPKPIKPLGDMKMAGLDRKERAQMLADELAEEEFGMDFYDLDIRTQMKIYQIALDMIDEGGNAMGGLPNDRTNFALGTRPTAQESGLGGLPIEADMRYTGGFMPYGAKEKADDVPARLSKNEFVFTADAVRAAGGGSVQKGAQKMYNTMKQLEAKPEAKGMMA
jgi:hypothetical protein